MARARAAYALGPSRLSHAQNVNQTLTFELKGIGESELGGGVVRGGASV